MVAEIRGKLDELNAALGEVTPFRLDVVAPGELVAAPKNARFMRRDLMLRLIENVKADGNLGSLPLCWKTDDGYHILSGHHRVEAALAAGVEAVLVLYTDKALSDQERIAIQLAHNAIEGQDDPTVLRELWEQMQDLECKLASGLTEEDIRKLEAPALDGFNAARLDYEQVLMLFLPEEIERIAAVLEQVTASVCMVAPKQDYDAFLDAIAKVKRTCRIINTGTALLKMCEIVEAALCEKPEKPS